MSYHTHYIMPRKHCFINYNICIIIFTKDLHYGKYHMLYKTQNIALRMEEYLCTVNLGYRKAYGM